jgi:hypothetical protein
MNPDSQFDGHANGILRKPAEKAESARACFEQDTTGWKQAESRHPNLHPEGRGFEALTAHHTTLTKSVNCS